MKRVCFTGHRPKELFGEHSIDNERARFLYKRVYNVCFKLTEEKGIADFRSGGAQGLDTIAFMAVHKLKEKHPHIQNHLSIPYEEFSSSWETTLERAKREKWSQKLIDDLEATIKRYEWMKEAADTLVYVDTLPAYQPKGMAPESIGKHDNRKMMMRNVHMLDESDMLVSCYNGSDRGGTYNTVTEAKKKGMLILNLNPNQDFKLELLHT
ncbi:DUF1273 family protein (plasmid) [Pontibacillus sp. ALD_SL1]|uniref:SLOG family protein n=1 Tax=Pontibacillus sp. ALD_SL1 TaxID=2777185 RepID=UPI001A976978|nr:SLOG family protein [Pontibacillus sp. ALD_SL1]QST02747.1 DUF1273 family protein [Pontibacillus sp. ALD_SL1]